MKIVSKQTLGFLIALLVIGGFLFWLSDTLAPIHGARKERMGKFLKSAENIEVISVGDSQSRALDYRSVRLRGFHLWMDRSDLFEVTYLLNAVTPLMPNLKIVFLNIGPMAFGRDNGSYQMFHSGRQMYYEVTPTIRSWRPIHGDIGNLIRGKFSPLVRHDHWRGVARSIQRMVLQRKGINETDRIDEFGYIGQPKTTSFDPVSRGAERQNRYKDFQWGNREIENAAHQELARTISRLRQKTVRIIVYTTPVPAITAQYLNLKHSNEIDRTRKYMQKLREQYGIEYYDYLNDEFFSLNNDYFFDETHLNKRGAEVFSRKLAAQAHLTR